MAAKKKIDDRVKEIILGLGLDWKEALWQHPQSGLWLMLHRYVEIAGAKAGIDYKFDEVEFNTKEGIAVVKCTASLGDNKVCTYGEASPKNNKNSYPVSMAEKRAYDRAVLKLIGVHGFIYSEDEIEHTKPEAKPEPKEDIRSIDDHISILKELSKDGKLKYWYKLKPETRNQIREKTDEFAS